MNNYAIPPSLLKFHTSTQFPVTPVCFLKKEKRALHEMVQTANKLRSAAVLCEDEPQSFNLESMH